MLPAHVKEGIKKAAAAVASGKMKPGDSMIVAEDDEHDMGDEGGSEEFHSLAQDMMDCLDQKDVEGLSSLLEEFCQHCKG